MILFSLLLLYYSRKLPTNCLSVFDHFAGLALEGLKKHNLTKKHDPRRSSIFIVDWKGNTISSFIAALNTSRPNLGQREKKQLKCVFSHFFVVFKKVFWRH